MSPRISDSSRGSRALHIAGVGCSFTFTCGTNNVLRAFSLIRKDEEAEIEVRRIEIDELTQRFFTV